MRVRVPSAAPLAALCACGLLAACGNDSVAGKTTTTGNGGGLVALGPDGHPLAGCIALAARSWDPVAGRPGSIDTLRGDATGTVILPEDSYAFVEIRDSARPLGAWIKRVVMAQGDRRDVALDTLRAIHGRWPDRSTSGSGRFYLDSSLQSASLGDDGSFAFAAVPPGAYALQFAPDAAASRPLGDVVLDAAAVRYAGSGNVLLDGDPTRSPLWFDDFESGTAMPLLRRSYPSASPWYMWSALMDMQRPATTDYQSILGAIGFDSTRGSNVLQARFAATDANGWMALGVTGLELDLVDRTEVCVSYRSLNFLKIQFQRDSVGIVRPTLSSTLPASSQWKDTCVATSGFVPSDDTPDSLRTWSTFGRRVLVVEFQTQAWGTYLDLDDIRMR